MPLAAHAGAGGARSRAISDRMSANICRDTATSAIWNVMYRPWLTTLAPILISFSRRLVSDHGFATLGIASVRMKLPRCRRGHGAGDARRWRRRNRLADRALMMRSKSACIWPAIPIRSPTSRSSHTSCGWNCFGYPRSGMGDATSQLWWERVRQRSSTDTGDLQTDDGGGRRAVQESSARPMARGARDVARRCIADPLSLIDSPEHLLNQAGAALLIRRSSKSSVSKIG